MTIRENLAEINQKIEEAAKKSGRNREDITLVAVTKTVGAEEVAEAYNAGQRVFAENRVQCLLEKLETTAQYNFEDAKWHLIGSLQTNKVKYIIDKVPLIHSVDSMHLAEEINKCATKKGIKMDCLLQVNVSGEESKHGVGIEEIDRFVEEFTKFDNICLKGLMTMAPFEANECELRSIFAKLHKKYIDIGSQKGHNVNMSYLSMGMTNDFSYAIEEGSNMVRVGTGIFH
ncbi:MAG: YggS family pyridoxal phosphate-dependent enzyme [Ruminococcaceae bacterium]|nr:YggS family pyridoxal phosphate-dependent enzyme [Oscillospiraceae bacterium]